MLIVTIDAGTTNTRVRAWQKENIIAEASSSIGVRDIAINKTKSVLTDAIKSCLDSVLTKAQYKPDQPLKIIASGMITSNVGLCEVPHLSAPVSINDLVNGMVKKVLPEIIEHPIYFVPGVKNNVANVTIDNFETMDMMRGEEVEVIGVIKQLNLTKPTLVILPGSHSKFVKIDAQNQIESCLTTLAGELLDVITKKTILASSVTGFANELDVDFLRKGAQYSQKVGIARGCFSTRILDSFMSLTDDQKASFLLGVVLHSDILAIKNSQALNYEPTMDIVVCGKKVLRQALYTLLSDDAFFIADITSFEEEKHANLSATGAITLMAQLINKEK